LRELQARLDPDPDVPPHLVDVPPCLHKYEPLFKRAAQAAQPPASG
jgi:hypothetical protein